MTQSRPRVSQRIWIGFTTPSFSEAKRFASKTGREFEGGEFGGGVVLVEVRLGGENGGEVGKKEQNGDFHALEGVLLVDCGVFCVLRQADCISGQTFRVLRHTVRIRGQAPDDRGQAPDDRGRTPDDRRLAPEDRGRTPDDRRLAPDDRGQAPDDRGQAPDDRGQTPDDRETRRSALLTSSVRSQFLTQFLRTFPGSQAARGAGRSWLGEFGGEGPISCSFASMSGRNCSRSSGNQRLVRST